MSQNIILLLIFPQQFKSGKIILSSWFIQKQAAGQTWPTSSSLPTSVFDLGYTMTDVILASWHLLLMGEMDIEQII